jgi:hypothetical protein
MLCPVYNDLVGIFQKLCIGFVQGAFVVCIKNSVDVDLCGIYIDFMDQMFLCTFRLLSLIKLTTIDFYLSWM